MVDKRKYWKDYYWAHKEHNNEMGKERRRRNKRDFSGIAKAKHWGKNYQEKVEPEEQKKWIREYNQRKRKELRIAVFNALSGGSPRCVRCGCDDIKLLEINHKNGGGRQEKKKKNPSFVSTEKFIPEEEKRMILRYSAKFVTLGIILS